MNDYVLKHIFLSTIILAAAALVLLPLNVAAVEIGANQNNVDEELYGPSQFKEGPDGNVYVFDYKDDFIKVYSPKTGSFIRKIGRSGQGPGEYMRFGAFNFTNSQGLFFTEGMRGHRWITFLELDGKFNKILKYKDENIFGLYHATMLKNGKIIAQVETRGQPEKNGSLYVRHYYRSLVIVDKNGKIEKTILKKKHIFAIAYTSRGIGPIIPDFPDFLWSVSKDNKIFFSEGNSNSLSIYNLDGNLTGQIKLSIADAPKMTKDEINRWADKRKKKVVKTDGIEFYKKFYSVAEHYKPFYGKQLIVEKISALPSGELLVSITKMTEDEFYSYYLIDQKGNVIEHIQTAASSIKIGEKLILFTLLDEEENVVLHCVERKKNETTILSAIPAIDD